MNKPFDFRYVDSVEPHAVRRKSLLAAHPEAKDLMGYDYRTGALMLLVLAGTIGVGATMQWLMSGPRAWGHWAIFIITTYAVGGTCTHWLSMGIHECSHYLSARTKLENRALAMLANIPLVIPSAMSFCRYHIDHHTYLGDRKRDNDLPTHFEIKVIGDNPVLKALWMYYYLFFAVFARDFINPPKRWEVVNIITQSIFMILVYQFIGAWCILFFALATFWGHGMHPVAAHWIHEHYLFESDQETNSYYGPLNKVTFNVGYHVEHHDLMNIPGWKLPTLHAMAPEFYQGLKSSKSWTMDLVHFVIRRGFGHHSRIIRNRDEVVKGKVDRSLELTRAF